MTDFEWIISEKTIVRCYGEEYKVPSPVSVYIDELEETIVKLRRDYTKIESELNCLKRALYERNKNY